MIGYDTNGRPGVVEGSTFGMFTPIRKTLQAVTSVFCSASEILSPEWSILRRKVTSLGLKPCNYAVGTVRGRARRSL